MNNFELFLEQSKVEKKNILNLNEKFMVPSSQIYLTKVFDYCVQYIVAMEKVPLYKNLPDLVKDLEFLYDFSEFLKMNEDRLVYGDSGDIEFSSLLIKKLDMATYFKKVHNNFPFFKEILNTKSMYIAAVLSEIYESIMIILFLIFTLSNEILDQDKVDDIVYTIKFRIYNLMLPNHLEDFEEYWGILHHLTFLKSSKI